MTTNAHGYDKKRFPLTAAQGRVLYHLERLFRSTGAGMREHAAYLRAVRAAGLDPERVADWSQDDCVLALGLMEHCAAPMAKWRPVATGREDFMPGGRFHRSTSWIAAGHPSLVAEAIALREVRPHDALGVV